MCVRGASSACGTRSFQRVTRRCAGSPAVRAGWPHATHACAPCSLTPADITCVLSSNVNSIYAFQNLSNADASKCNFFSQDLGPPYVAPLYLVPLFYFKKNAHTLFFLIPYPQMAETTATLDGRMNGRRTRMLGHALGRRRRPPRVRRLRKMRRDHRRRMATVCLLSVIATRRHGRKPLNLFMAKHSPPD